MQDQRRNLLRRSDVPVYAKEKHGVSVSKKTLDKWAVTGGGPPMTYWGRIPYYDAAEVDRWIVSRLSRPVSSTSERASA